MGFWRIVKMWAFLDKGFILQYILYIKWYLMNWTIYSCNSKFPDLPYWLITDQVVTILLAGILVYILTTSSVLRYVYMFNSKFPNHFEIYMYKFLFIYLFGWMGVKLCRCFLVFSLASYARYRRIIRIAVTFPKFKSHFQNLKFEKFL